MSEYDSQTDLVLLDVMAPPYACYFRAVPVRMEAGVMTVLMDDPSNMDAIDSMYHIFVLDNLVVKQVTQQTLDALLDKHFSSGKKKAEEMKLASTLIFCEGEGDDD